ncbi:lysozyme inhibitor LprI family protein [Psychrobacter sp. 72-O-c]|uniref:lysozyme inhibitor LprI family protein n=1 Tax=Psychrobacter sp. 72-O-c TaxID=2774125 RepID=UPI00191AD759|nr:lysozyme inhibitor LprI family protein [Psychrobacter sp. 72-O-c]
MRLNAILSKIGIGVSMLVSLSIPALAANYCDNAYYQVDLNECTAIHLSVEDRQLNKSYGNLQPLLDSSERNQLKLAQRAWINFRDKACEFSARNLKGGSAYVMEHNSCLTNYTHQRRVELDEEIERIQ